MKLWRSKKRIERQYERALHRLLDKTMSAFFISRSVASFKRRIRSWVRSKDFDDFAHAVARKMITALFDDVGHDWRSAAREDTQGRRMYEGLEKRFMGKRGERLKQLIHDDAKLIKSLPLDMSEQAVEYIRNEIMKGRHPEAIADEIGEKFGKLSKNRAKLIARTEGAKTRTAIIQADCEHIGCGWYVWRTSADQRTRGAHAMMAGVICSWDDPPEPEALFPGQQKPYGAYHPGCTFNCRCYPAPIVTHLWELRGE